jgi:hypothetical protein
LLIDFDVAISVPFRRFTSLVDDWFAGQFYGLPGCRPELCALVTGGTRPEIKKAPRRRAIRSPYEACLQRRLGPMQPLWRHGADNGYIIVLLFHSQTAIGFISFAAVIVAVTAWDSIYCTSSPLSIFSKSVMPVLNIRISALISIRIFHSATVVIGRPPQNPAALCSDFLLPVHIFATRPIGLDKCQGRMGICQCRPGPPQTPFCRLARGVHS